MAIVWVLISIAHAVSWGNHQSAGEMVFQSRGEMVNVWTADGGREDQLPPVNFDKETVLAVFAGAKNGSGYKIKIMRIVKQQDGKQVVVLYQTADPEVNAGGKTTYPNHVVTIAKTEGDFKFLDVDTTEGKQFIAALQAQDAAQGAANPAAGGGGETATAKMAALIKAAEGGDATAQFTLGKYYFAGEEGIKKDPVEGLKWMKKSFDKSPENQYLFGVMQLTGDKVPKDPLGARDTLERAGDRGWAPANRILGLMYMGKLGLDKNVDKSTGYIKKAAAGNDANGQYLLALLYMKGEGVDQSVEEAYKWMKKAADQGFELAVQDLPKIEASLKK